MSTYFNRRLQGEYRAFLACIEGIDQQADREWYAALMLTRLLFLCFLQKRGCLAPTRSAALDGDSHYLLTHLHRAREQADTRPFYRSFLLRLFHEGLGGKADTAGACSECPEASEALFGKLPPIASSLFAEHELERAYPAISIPDEAFARLFAFFEQFDWCLEDDPHRSKQAVTPEIIGALFARHANQKQPGSYYTLADITAYINATTIIPCFLTLVQQQCPAAFTRHGPIWSLLSKDPERYMHDALKHGCALSLPPEIEAGVENISLRHAWNQPAPAIYALPLESWREVVARRQRYTSLIARLSTGSVCAVDDLITLNLDLCRFARDAILCCDNADMLIAFYTSLERVTILDPTCGTGAFLLAALRILEPLYVACLVRLCQLLAECECGSNPAGMRRNIACVACERLRALLQEIEKYPSRQYFIRRTILTQNLYGIDILPEAVECCKLRLFLALLAPPKIFAEIEPLSDLVPHVRVGNALVGCASLTEVSQAELSVVARRAELDGVLAIEYGLDRLDMGENYDRKLVEWRKSTRPFHWCLEFTEVMCAGGFTVIIGNPPYVVCKKARAIDQARAYETQPCGNLYAYILERALTLLRVGGRCGMIVPISAISGENYRSLSTLLLQRQVWVSSYSNRPGQLFPGVEQRLAILLISNAQPPALFTSPYRHWYEPERAYLFATLIYTRSAPWSRTGMPLKSGTEQAEAIFAQLSQRADFPQLHCSQPGAAVWLHNGPTYWVRALPFEPNMGHQSARSNHYRKIPVNDQRTAYLLAAILSSSTFYFFYKLVSNCRDLGSKELQLFPLGQLSPALAERLANLGCSLAKRLQETAHHCARHYPSGVSVYEEYYPASAKEILDEIDRVLAEHYGFSPEELDFVLNYEIKYRLHHHLSGSAL